MKVPLSSHLYSNFCVLQISSTSQKSIPEAVELSQAAYVTPPWDALALFIPNPARLPWAGHTEGSPSTWSWQTGHRDGWEMFFHRLREMLPLGEQENLSLGWAVIPFRERRRTCSQEQGLPRAEVVLPCPGGITDPSSLTPAHSKTLLSRDYTQQKLFISSMGEIL